MIKKLIRLQLYDNCKKCGCNSFECKHCNNNEFYRHIDNKKRMRLNLSIIRKKGLPIKTIKCFFCNENFEISESHINKTYLIHDCKLHKELHNREKIIRLTVIKESKSDNFFKLFK